jgi:hypothetical protein
MHVKATAPRCSSRVMALVLGFLRRRSMAPSAFSYRRAGYDLTETALLKKRGLHPYQERLDHFSLTLAGYNLIRLPKLIAAKAERQPGIGNFGVHRMTFKQHRRAGSNAGYSREPEFSAALRISPPASSPARWGFLDPHPRIRRDRVSIRVCQRDMNMIGNIRRIDWVYCLCVANEGLTCFHLNFLGVGRWVEKFFLNLRGRLYVVNRSGISSGIYY